MMPTIFLKSLYIYYIYFKEMADFDSFSEGLEEKEEGGGGGVSEGFSFYSTFLIGFFQ